MEALIVLPQRARRGEWRPPEDRNGITSPLAGEVGAQRRVRGKPRDMSEHPPPAERVLSVRKLGEGIMVHVFECGSVVPGCKFVIHADERDEVLAKAIEHMYS